MESTILTALTLPTHPHHENLLSLLLTTRVTGPYLIICISQLSPGRAPWIHDGNILCRTGKNQTPHVVITFPLRIGIKLSILVQIVSGLVCSIGSAN